jgi:hypothetical protein
MCFHPEISQGLDIPCTPSIVCPSLAAASQSTQPAPLPSQPTTSQHPPEPSDESDVDPDDDPDDGTAASITYIGLKQRLKGALLAAL